MVKKEKDSTVTCFTFEVTMLVHVIAEELETAKTKLDSEGGIMTKRETTLIDSVPLKSTLEKNN